MAAASASINFFSATASFGEILHLCRLKASHRRSVMRAVPTMLWKNRQQNTKIWKGRSRKLWEEQYLSSGDIALIAECGTIGVSFA